MDFTPISSKDKQEMLDAIGVKDTAELFSVIPEKARIKKLNLPEGISEAKLLRTLDALSRKNFSLKEYTCFRGAGIYEHFVPALVEEIASRSEFTTAYTPYQPEASQGTLQAVFEYQSMITGLTGLDVANASLYDGASAVAEAALLALRATGRKKLFVSEAVHPEYREVLRTYLQGIDVEIKHFTAKNGSTAPYEIDADAAAVIIQSPNFFGIIEDAEAFRRIATQAGAMLIMSVNPISLGLLKTPGEFGADIAVGEGQVLGSPSGLGGFTFGFMACKKELAWKMPGRIVGQTTDTKGRRGYVLTLQSREQHIRREKATSNICTNSALNALAGCVYLSGWGSEGLKKLAETNAAKSGYAFNLLSKLPGFEPAFYNQPFFNEFVLKTKKNINKIYVKLLSEKILGPLGLGRFYKGMDDCLLFCVTELRTKEEIDKLAKILSSKL
ncbi:MAG: aminomethyl-transferring glycine dehydrogenase subunit GcvPA [Elusimicrobiota bacterium]